MKIEGKDIVVVGIQPWDIPIGSNCKDIAMEFSKNNRVLYINNPVSNLELLKKNKTQIVKNRLEVINDKSKALVKIDENLWAFTPPITVYPINSIPVFSIFSFFNRLNNKKFADSIKQAISSLNFTKFILFNDQNMFLGYFLKELLNPSIYAYYIRDNLLNVKYWQKHGVKIEPKLIAKADIVFTNSLLYEDYARKHNKNSFMVGQGCDTELYNNDEVQTAEEVEGMKKPIIGYVGFLSSKRLDIEVIKNIALKRSDYTILLVGPEDDTFKKSDLHDLPNIKFLGSKPPNSLPSYIKAFDVAINPQKLTKATLGNYPRKIDEYLAMGKATVATWTKAMEYFNDSVYLAKDKDEFLEKIDFALENDSTELRQMRAAIGHSHSWTTSVNLMYSLILKSNS